MPSARRRLALATLIVVVPLAAADAWIASRIVDGRFRGMRVPPFGTLVDPAQRETLARIAARQRAGDLRDRTPRGWSPRYGWVNRPGSFRQEGETYRFTSLGARGSHEIGPDPPPGQLRVACFGDSFTYGTEVRDGEDWPAVLGELDPRLEVVNLGVGAWGTDQALLLYRERGPSLRADVVLIGFCMESIARNVNRYRSLYQPQTKDVLVKPRFLLVDGRLELLPIPFEHQYEVYEAALSGELGGVMGEHDWWAEPAPFPAFSGIARAWAAARAQERREVSWMHESFDSEPYQVSLAILEAFHREALQAGARLAPVLIFATRSQHLRERQAGSRLWKDFERALQERGVPAVNVVEALGPERPEDEIYVTAHYNARGNREAALAVRDWLAAHLEE